MLALRGYHPATNDDLRIEFFGVPNWQLTDLQLYLSYSCRLELEIRATSTCGSVRVSDQFHDYHFNSRERRVTNYTSFTFASFTAQKLKNAIICGSMVFPNSKHNLRRFRGMPNIRHDVVLLGESCFLAIFYFPPEGPRNVCLYPFSRTQKILNRESFFI